MQTPKVKHSQSILLSSKSNLSPLIKRLRKPLFCRLQLVAVSASVRRWRQTTTSTKNTLESTSIRSRKPEKKSSQTLQLRIKFFMAEELC